MMKMHLTVLDPDKPEQDFPPVDQALNVPDGLLAVGGCLSQTRLLNAYRQGIFPWSSADEPILWWSPDPRLVLFPRQLQVSRSLAKTIRRQTYKLTYDRCFVEVVSACAKPRKEDAGTWITQGIMQSYLDLHHSGYAHSVEAWQGNDLVGGLYGVAIGQVFFGESMFFNVPDASKVAFATLVKSLQAWNYQLIDCQVSTAHLKTFGAEEISRNDFNVLLDRYCELAPDTKAWQTP